MFTMKSDVVGQPSLMSDVLFRMFHIYLSKTLLHNFITFV
jgi:hypothetical protein